MNNIGLLIKMSRIQQNMKQITLAKGICSTSYLSKIENSQTVPSEDVLELLLKRLNLNFSELTTDDEDDDEIVIQVYTLYKEAIIERNMDIIKEKLNCLLEKKILFRETKNYYLFNLYSLRIKLMIDPSNNKSGNILEGLNHVKNHFDNRQHFFFNFNYGLQQYLNKNYKAALEHIDEASSYISKFHIENWEKADFYNVSSLVNLSCEHLVNAIEFANKSLEIYKDMFIFKRAIDNYIVIGIAHKKNANYKNAEESFLLAQKISSDLNLNEYKSILNHNLGALYSVRGRSTEAINYYLNSLEDSLTLENSLTTIFSIVQEYSKLKNSDAVNVWSQKGINHISKIDNPRFIPYKYHFNLYLALYGEDLNKEQIFINTVDYFEKIEDYRHAHKYSIILAEYYSNHRKYKNSSMCFHKANIYLYKLKSLNTWEDL